MLNDIIFIVTLVLLLIALLSMLRIINKEKHVTILSDRQVNNLKHPKE